MEMTPTADLSHHITPMRAVSRIINLAFVVSLALTVSISVGRADQTTRIQEKMSGLQERISQWIAAGGDPLAIGFQVAQIGLTESNVHGVAKAISWLRAHFAQPVKVEELAKLAHMSVSSFHQHFRAVTSMSPLQFQKVLRLQEARRLMLSMVDSGTASWRVGYQSPSQFSREYGRLFGSAPTKDIARLRELPNLELPQTAA